MNKAEWLAARKTGVSGTDISILLGHNAYKTESQLLMDKLGIVGPRGEFTGNAATRAGQLLEPVISDLWSWRKQVITTPGQFTRSPQNQRFIGTPDYLTGTGNGLEIKTGIEKTWNSGCPKNYEDQCRWYAMITERPTWDLYAVIVPKDRSNIPFGNPDEQNDGSLMEWTSYRPVREYQFERNQEWEEKAQALALQFLRRVDSMKAPLELGLLTQGSNSIFGQFFHESESLKD